MEKEFISTEREVLFIPPPTESVAGVENRFKDRGVRFTWVNADDDLLEKLNVLPPQLLILDVSRLNGGVAKVLSQIEEHLGDCKTIVFGKDSDLQTLVMEHSGDIVFSPESLDPATLSTTLESILTNGWGPFRRDCIVSRPYALLFCHSTQMEKVRTVVDQVAPTDLTLLIEGEGGTGKELVAQAVHFKSYRRQRPLIKVNCAVIPSQRLESELFGFEKGAFSGAQTRKPGKFELAREGTIFLDEIGCLDGSLQAKLLRVLQDDEFSPLGGKDSIKINARFIASTKQNLRYAVDQGRFREDLYYRINVVNIPVPPLRERKEEIPSLSQYFLSLYNTRYGRSYPKLSLETEEVFLNHDWPENVRQLERIIKRIVVLGDEKPVIRELIGEQGRTTESAAYADPIETSPEREEGLKDVGRRAAKEAEKAAIKMMLGQTRWNRRRTAELLQISYKALLYKIREYGLDQ
jgi:two-component system response regulator AtoC